jgi:glycosyltransferase involved in cell wall biosynthesis
MGSLSVVERPLVSIVMPVYNGEVFLAEAIDSLLAQDYPNIEIIVLDDGSVDGTRAVLETYGKRILWASHENMGQANTLNKGWQMAKGDVLSYLSADDVLFPGAVSASLKYLTGDVVLTYCDFRLVDSSSKYIRKVSAPDFNFLDMFGRLICQPGPGVFFTRAAFQSAGLWNSAFPTNAGL